MMKNPGKMMRSAAKPLAIALSVAFMLAALVVHHTVSVRADHGELPGAPLNLRVDATDFRSIDLSWDAPSGGGSVETYRLDRSRNGNVWLSHKTGITRTEYQDTMLEPETTYYYRVFALNGAGTGPVSQYFIARTRDATEPGPVRNVRAASRGPNQINLTWTAPAELNGSPIEKYFIHFGMGDDPQIPAQAEVATNANVIEVDATDGTSYEHKGLTSAKRYSYIVYAENATGKSTVSSNTSGATTAPLVRPGAPAGVTAVQTGDRVFTLYWYAPTDTGGTDVVDYEVHVSYNGGAFAEESGITWTNAVGTSADSVEHTVLLQTTGDNPVDITRVQYRVYAITRKASSGPPSVEELKSARYGQSQQMRIIAIADREGLIPVAPDIATGDKVSRDAKGNVRLEWDAPTIDSDDRDTTNNNAPDSIGGYRIDVSDDGLNWRTLVNHTRKTATEHRYVDLERKDRHYRVFAWHSQYLGPAQDTVAVSRLNSDGVVYPGHVRNFSATVAGPSRIDLSWTAPENDGNSPIIEYRIDGRKSGVDGTFGDFAQVSSAAEARVAGDSGPSNVEAVVESTRYSHEGLKAGETWEYRVLAITDDSGSSKRYRVSPAGSAPTRRATTPQEEDPAAPEMLVAQSVNGNGGPSPVELLWNAPMNPEGASVSGYRVQWMKNDGGWITLEPDTEDPKTDYMHNVDLEDGEMRAYRVAAISTNKKVGQWSNTARIPVTSQVPGMPSSVSADPDRSAPDSKLVVSWAAPTSYPSSVTGYTLERRWPDDMVGDIPSDGYNADVNGATYVFTNHKEWWETLNCKGMLRVVGSVSDPTVSSGDRVTYCKHFADTMPTNQPFDGQVITPETAAKVKELFDKRYVTGIAAGSRSYVDPDLEESTEYTYRIRAVHGSQSGPWSTAVSASTSQATGSLVPGQPASIAAMSHMDAPDSTITVSWEEPSLNPGSVTGYTLEREWIDDMVGDIPDDGYDADVNGESYAFADHREWWETLNCKGRLSVAGSTADHAASSSDKDMYCKHFAHTMPTNQAFDGRVISNGTAARVKEMFDRRYVVGKAPSARTHVDSNLAEDTEYTYRVRAVNGTKAGPWSAAVSAATTQSAGSLVPGAPASIAAMSHMDSPDSTITVSWEEPSLNPGSVTGYTLEREWIDDMVGDIPADGYDDSVNGASYAFSDHREWWETLNCKGRLRVAGSSADHAASSSDKDMYCKHFAHTMPTNQAFDGRVISNETAVKVKEMFDRRYVVGKGPSARTHVDSNLTEDTEYTYRVRAVNGTKAGPWSVPVVVSTDPSEGSMVPGVPDSVAVSKDTLTDNPATRLLVSWLEPEENAGVVTGYTLEREWIDDMVGDIPPDGYNDSVNGRTYAFTNHKEWWETLNCKGMLSVVGSSADPTDSSGDKDTYCKHFAHTMPTNQAFDGQVISESVESQVRQMFDKRYVVRIHPAKRWFLDTGLASNTEYIYRLRAVNGPQAGPWSEAVALETDPSDQSQPPGEPTFVTATKDDDKPDSSIRVSWVEPALNADVVTSYMLERRWPGDMVGVIPSDGYNGDVNGETYAFTNYREWWETLNCKGKLKVSDSGASPEADSDDRTTYCKHFANTMPTNMAFEGQLISEFAAARVREMFGKRYVVRIHPEIRSYLDTNLDANTGYTYRVRAVNGPKAGPWSDAVMAGTDPRIVIEPEAPTDLRATVISRPTGEVDISVSWIPGAHADLHAVVLFNAVDYTDWKYVGVSTTDRYTFEDVAAGSYVVVVVVLDDDGEPVETEYGDYLYSYSNAALLVFE